jgi:hypothetical protein
MKDNSQLEGQKELKSWIKRTHDSAVKELMGRKIVDVLVAEAKPAWVFPHQILIGKVRGRGQEGGHIWFICGDRIPTDHVHSSKASSPREAARHFALKWQLDAARAKETWDRAGGKWLAGARSAHGQDELIEQAGALYELVTVDRLWES